MIDSILAEQLVSLILEMATDQVKAYFTHRREKRQFVELVEEYQMRAAGISSIIDLPARMNNPHLIEELLAHCILGDKTRDDAVALFVGENADQNARDFGRGLFDQMYLLISKTGTPEAGPSLPGINRNLAATDKILKRICDIDHHLSDLSSPDINAQMALLQTVVSSLESASLAVADLPTLIEECNGSPAGKYLEAYLALCRNDTHCSKLPDVFCKRDQLIIPIVSLAISSGYYEYALTTLDLTSFDAAQLKNAIRNVFVFNLTSQEPTTISAPLDLNLESFAMFLNAENAYSHKAYTAAEDLFSQLDGQMNPIARFHSAVSVLFSDSLYGRDTLAEHVKAAIDESCDWMPVELFQQLTDALMMACAKADADMLEDALQNAPEYLLKHFEAPKIILELSRADTFEEALMLMARGMQCRNISAILEPAIKALSIDTSRKGLLAKEFLKNKDWLFASPVPLAFYAKELATINSYQEYQELGARINQTAEYHLLAYDLFRETQPEPAKEHMDSALAALHESMVNPLQALPEIWVTYLVESGLTQDVVDLASPYLPRESLETIEYFLSICRHTDHSGVVFNRLLEVLANSDVFDTRVPEFLASYFASIDDVPTAGRLALKAFRLHKTETSAAIVASWCITSSLKLDEDVRDYIERTDTQMMNLVYADIAEIEGNSTRGDQLLIRAAFREGNRAESALTAYAARHIGNTDAKEYHVIEQDTCVTIEAENGTINRIFFFSERDMLVSPCASGPAGKAFSIKTPVFIGVRGCTIGETITIGDISGIISGIESVEAGLSRKGLELITKDPRSIVIRADDSDNFLDQIANAMQPQSSSLECYTSGINIDGVTIYPGIETARRFGAPDKLEFTIEAIENEKLPFRRYQLSRNSPIDSGASYLLSYSATVCLALLKPPADTLNSVTAKCSITESTARRLENECHTILDDCYTSPGKLSLVDGRLALFQNDETVKQQCRDIVLCISELVSILQKTVPSTRVPTFEYAEVLCDNTAIDIQTAIDNGLTYVTEDCLEAQMIDATESLSRCSLTVLLIGCQEYRYFLTDFCTTMQKWGAQPVLEEDIIRALNSVAKPTTSE